MALNLSFKSFMVPRDLGWNRARAVCRLPECHNKLLMRYVPGSRTGIHVGDTWYCSPDCFAADSRNTLALLLMSGVVEMPRNPRLSLGLALLSKGYLTEDQLRFATLRSQCQGETLEATLIELALVGEKQLAAARGAQWGYPVLAQDPIGQFVESDLPPALFEAFSAVPIHYSVKARRLVLGFVDRVEHGLLQAIEQITGFRAEPCFITPTEYAEQLLRLKKAAGYEQVLVDKPGNVAEMARTLGGFALEFSAGEACFARCKSWVWARIRGKRGTMDAIFDLRNAPAGRGREFSTVLPELSRALG